MAGRICEALEGRGKLDPGVGEGVLFKSENGIETVFLQINEGIL